MKRNLYQGAIFWSLQPSIESLGCQDPNEPNFEAPWIGKLDLRGKVPILYRFNEETGEMDEDPNAGAFINKPATQLFPTFKRAQTRFIHYLADQLGDPEDTPRAEVIRKIRAYLETSGRRVDIRELFREIYASRR